MENNDKKTRLVTTDSDFWNSADEARFSVAKGQVKPLPETLTIIIEDALKQGLLRDATPEEINKQEMINGMEQCIIEGKIKIGNTPEDTMKNYKDYLAAKELLNNKPIIEEKPLQKSEEKTEKPVVKEKTAKEEIFEKKDGEKLE